MVSQSPVSVFGNLFPSSSSTGSSPSSSTGLSSLSATASSTGLSSSSTGAPVSWTQPYYNPWNTPNYGTWSWNGWSGAQTQPQQPVAQWPNQVQVPWQSQWQQQWASYAPNTQQYGWTWQTLPQGHSQQGYGLPTQYSWNSFNQQGSASQLPQWSGSIYGNQWYDPNNPSPNTASIPASGFATNVGA